MAEWYYAKGRQRFGPVSQEELLRLGRDGLLAGDDLIWTEGMPDWREARTVQGLVKTAEGGGPPPTPTAAPTRTQCHEVDYQVVGSDLQAVEVELDPGETVIAEGGAMNYMDDGVRFEAKLGDGSNPTEGVFGKVFGAAKRALTHETVFLTHFTNDGQGKRRVAFAAPYPGMIIPADLAKLGGQVTVQKDAFLAAALGTRVDIALHKRLGAGFFGGEGFILQRLTGDGMVFLHAGGTVVERRLGGGRILVDTGCLVGFTGGIDYDIHSAGGIKSMLFGGEGLFLAQLQGTGTVWLQTLPFSRLVNRIASSARISRSD